MADYFTGQKLKNIEASIDTLVVFALSEKEKRIRKIVKKLNGNPNYKRTPFDERGMQLENAYLEGFDDAKDEFIEWLKK